MLISAPPFRLTFKYQVDIRNLKLLEDKLQGKRNSFLFQTLQQHGAVVTSCFLFLFLAPFYHPAFFFIPTVYFEIPGF